MRLVHTLATASAALLVATAGFAQTSNDSAASNTNAAQAGGAKSQSAPYDLASEITCEDFLVLDTPDQGQILVELMPASANPSADGSHMTKAHGSTDTSASANATGSTTMPKKTDDASQTANANGSTDATTAPANGSTDMASNESTSNGASQKNDKALPAMVTGVFEFCSNQQSAKVSDGMHHGAQTNAQQTSTN